MGRRDKESMPAVVLEEEERIECAGFCKWLEYKYVQSLTLTNICKVRMKYFIKSQPKHLRDPVPLTIASFPAQANMYILNSKPDSGLSANR